MKWLRSGLRVLLIGVCTENSNPAVVVVKSTQDGA
jgi:hypothetical protein